MAVDEHKAPTVPSIELIELDLLSVQTVDLRSAMLAQNGIIV